MGLFKNPFAKAEGPEAEVQDFPTASIKDQDCSTCEIKYPASFKQDDSPIWKSCPPTASQILVATGETDWSRDPADDKAPYAAVIKQLNGADSRFEAIVGGKIRINATNEDNTTDKIKVTVLPQFVQIETTPETCVNDVARILSLKAPGDYSPEIGQKMYEKGIILLCSHKTRDKKCGISAPLVKKALDLELRDTDLYRDYGDDTPGGVRVVYVNHVGGHKWAANCFYYGNDGSSILMAMVRPEHAHAIVHKTIVEGVVLGELLRNCSRNAAFAW